MKASLTELILTQANDPRYAGLPAHRRYFEIIRRAILDHLLPNDARLPSSRALATELGCARNILVLAYEQLQAEGFIEARSGSGSYVTDTRPNLESARPTTTLLPLAGKATRRISRRGELLIRRPADRHYEIQALVPDQDDFSAFPTQLWQRLQNRHWRAPAPAFLDYSRSGGHWALREALAEHLRLTRSVRLTARQILITAGTQQSLDLCTRLLTDGGDQVWLENPGYWGAHRVFSANELAIRPITVDREGIHPSTDDLMTQPKLIYVTPSHQYPTDVVMSLARRRLLIDFAARIGAWILEDDYDAEFRYRGAPLASLQGLDDHERVIYLGTFSKVLYPGIRIGYIAAPGDLLDAFQVGLSDVQRPGQMAVQAALADFIREGHFASHIRNLRARYGQCRAILQFTLQQALNPAAALSSADTGLHLVIHLPTACDDVALAAAARARQISVKPLSGYFFAPPVNRGLVLGYGYTPLNALAPAARTLAEIINQAIADESGR